MARKRNGKAQETPPTEEPVVEEPGYCIGHFDKADKACEMCEIQDECRQLTSEIHGEDDKEADDGEKKE